MKFTPAARLFCTISLTGFWSSAPTTVQNPLPPKVIVPRQISDTNNPVLPSWLYFIGDPPVSGRQDRKLRPNVFPALRLFPVTVRVKIRSVVWANDQIKD